MDLIQRDLKHIWHPCSQMKDYETFLPIEISRAEGSYLIDAQGNTIIDAISSWWCKSLGHNHPRLKQALIEQTEKFEHVILANTTNKTIVELSERLAQLSPTLDKVSYASDGSCAVEMALKMSLQVRRLLGQHGKQRYMALSNAYHGETSLALAVSDLGLYREHYEAILPPVAMLEHIPYVSSCHDALWHDCSSVWPQLEAQLNQQVDHLTAIIIEPILQGAGGMKIYSQDFLRRLRVWTKQHDVHLIADEILTGFGRTGKALACEHAEIEPDFLCIAKGLTAGWLPMSAMLTSTDIYDIFYDDYETGKAFMHSHTHTGNVLAAAVALAVLAVKDDEAIYERVETQSDTWLAFMQSVADETQMLQNVRGIGGMVAADLIAPAEQRLGYRVYQTAIKMGALLRPLGNTLYWLPPLNTPMDVMEKLRDITCAAVLEHAE